MDETKCARCGSTMDQAQDVLPGVCDPCFEKLISSPSEELSGLLEHHHSPAALIDSDMTVVAVNGGFEQIFRGDHELRGMKVGSVLDCIRPTAETPCGETYSCPHCGIRRLVDATRASGERIRRVAMSFRHKSGLDRTYVFTTHKRGDTVLLSIGA